MKIKAGFFIEIGFSANTGVSYDPGMIFRLMLTISLPSTGFGFDSAQVHVGSNVEGAAIVPPATIGGKLAQFDLA